MAIVTAARYNNAQARVNAILGTGSSTEGYGQQLASSQVRGGLPISAQQINNLYADLLDIRIHQTGATPTSISQVTAGESIGEDESAGDTAAGFQDYEDFISVIETASERFKLAVSQSTTLVNAKNSVRTQQWNQVVDTEFLVSFDSADHRRHFFNSGGSITFVSSLTNLPNSGSGVAKSANWAAILTNAGTVSFNYDVTTSSGTGTGSTIGNYDLSASYQKIHTKTGSGVYAAADYFIYAKELNNYQILFRLEFNDENASIYTTDEMAQGRLEAKIGFVRASGNYVDVSPPSFSVYNGNTL